MTEVEKLTAERNQWKHWAEALMNAIKGYCNYCRYRHILNKDEPCRSCFPDVVETSRYQFDEARFAPEEGE